MTVATWNLWHVVGPHRVLPYLESARWDIVCLQEMNKRVRLGIQELVQTKGWHFVDGLELGWEREWSQHGPRARPHAAGIVARDGWQLEDPALIEGMPLLGRAVSATARKGDANFGVISWHADHTKLGDPTLKMKSYDALIEAIDSFGEVPLVAGIDSNHATNEVEWELPLPPSSDDLWEIENRFFSREPQHRLLDALRLDYAKHPEKFEAAKRERPDGPFEITHRLQRTRTPYRFDFVLVSPEFEVMDTEHDYERAAAPSEGSDHAFVSADLALRMP